jgi:hemolysin activation/secretion protein
MKITKSGIIILLIFAMAGGIYGQNPSPSERLKEEVISQERRETLDDINAQQKKEKEEEREKQKKESEALGIEEGKSKKIVFLKELKFSKSNLLEESFFEGLKEKYENTEVSVEDIYAIVNAVNNEYMMKGYIASQAFLRDQDITSGSLLVSMIEGIISAVKLSGNKSTRENYIKRYIKIENADNFKANETNAGIMKFNAANDANARIALSAGKVLGTSEVDIIIDEPKRYSAGVFTDNSGQEETGKIRYGGYATLRSITGYRDIFNVGGVFTEGSNAVYASYEIPEPFFNTRVGVGFDYSDTQIINGETIKNLNITGNYYNVNVYIKKPFLVREDSVNNITFSGHTRKGESYISSLKTQDTKTDVLSISADNTYMFNGGYVFNMLSYGQGLKLINGESSFEKISYYGEGFLSLPYDFGVSIKLRGQASFDTEPSSEQFGVGGMNSVRGYREGMLMGKNGMSASAEVQYDVKRIRNKIIKYGKVYGFFDFGQIYYEKEDNIPDDYEDMISGSGVGIRMGIYGYVELHLVCALPVVKHKYYENDAVSFLFFVQGRI